MDVKAMTTFREDLAAMGYKFQFITLAGFHANNTVMFELSKAYMERGMAGYSELQQREFALESAGFQAIKHQSFVGTGYFDAVQQICQQGQSSTTALAGSTEAEQFHWLNLFDRYFKAWHLCQAFFMSAEKIIRIKVSEF